MVAVTSAPIPWEAQMRSGENKQGSPRAISAVLDRASRGNRTGWRYASFVTPGALIPPEISTGGDGGERCNQHKHDLGGGVGRNSTETCAREARHDDRDGSAQSPTAVALPFPEGTTGTHGKRERAQNNKDNLLSRLTGERRSPGPGPGLALWIPNSNTTPGLVGRGNTGSHPHRPKKAKVRRLVRHLEAELKLKGRPGAGGLPVLAHNKIDMPYTKELAKWSYDEILGIPRTTVPTRSSKS